jgi:hypothetical protein
MPAMVSVVLRKSCRIAANAWLSKSLCMPQIYPVNSTLNLHESV